MIMKKNLLLWCILFAVPGMAQNGIVVFQSDFGSKDGAVAAMKGVASSVSTHLKLYDLTHDIPAYNIWEAAYRLEQTVPYWPPGTVFVSVVDPGVGTHRTSVVLKTKSGHFIVTPDNGTLTLVARSLGIDSICAINEAVNRRPQQRTSYTFHGRDVYAYTGARLASGIISFAETGRLLPPSVVSIPHQPAVAEGKALKGAIPILDVQYGNVWTNIPDTLLEKSGIRYGDSVSVKIWHHDGLVYHQRIPFVPTFGAVAEGQALAYLNSLLQLSLAVNMGSFAEKYRIQSGPGWRVEISRSAAPGSAMPDPSATE